MVVRECFRIYSRCLHKEGISDAKCTRQTISNENLKKTHGKDADNFFFIMLL